MSAPAAIVVVAIVAVFGGFAVLLAWADRYSSGWPKS